MILYLAALPIYDLTESGLSKIKIVRACVLKVLRRARLIVNRLQLCSIYGDSCYADGVYLGLACSCVCLNFTDSILLILKVIVIYSNWLIPQFGLLVYLFTLKSFAFCWSYPRYSHLWMLLNLCLHCREFKLLFRITSYL